jgi:xanthine dehydrogenase accessory factor
MVQARLVVGLGPGFTPGLNCAAVVETNRGHRLGRVYWDRPADADTGQPEGDPRRVLRMAAAGIVQPAAQIGSLVEQGDVLAVVAGERGEEAVRAGLAGVLRGMVRPGLRLPAGAKIGDIDPRADPSYCGLVSDKSLAIGGGVLEAVMAWMQHSRG